MTHAEKIAGLCFWQQKTQNGPALQSCGKDVRPQDKLLCPRGAEPIQQVHKLSSPLFSLCVLMSSYNYSDKKKDITIKTKLTKMVFFHSTDRNSRSQIRPVRSDSVPESFSDKDGLCKTGLLENPKPIVQTVSSPDLGISFLLNNQPRFFITRTLHGHVCTDPPMKIIYTL